LREVKELKKLAEEAWQETRESLAAGSVRIVAVESTAGSLQLFANVTIL